LRKMGADIDVVPAYRTITPEHDTGRVREMLEKGEIDMVTFTSSSTVTNFVEMFKQDAQELQKWMARVTIACIGPITARTAEDNGFTINLAPPEYTIESLTDSIVKHFIQQQPPST
jgi:uroporphyrinogen III methyltransferase / synthase